MPRHPNLGLKPLVGFIAIVSVVIGSGAIWAGMHYQTASVPEFVILVAVSLVALGAACTAWYSKLNSRPEDKGDRILLFGIAAGTVGAVGAVVGAALDIMVP